MREVVLNQEENTFFSKNKKIILLLILLLIFLSAGFMFVNLKTAQVMSGLPSSEGTKKCLMKI